MLHLIFFFFFFNDTATTEIYTLSLHDALPILHLADPSPGLRDDGRYAIRLANEGVPFEAGSGWNILADDVDRKSTRLNSSHLVISYAVFCLKKKKNQHLTTSHKP